MIVSKRKIMATVCFAIFLMPSYFTTNISLIKTLLNIIFLFTVLFLFQKRYKPSAFALVSTVYFLLLFIETQINGNMNVHLLISNMKTLAFVCFLDYFLDDSIEFTVELLTKIVTIYCVFDFASIIFFPDGLYTTEIVWNEWSTSDRVSWLFGPKNNRVYWYLAALFLAFIYDYLSNTYRTKIRLVLTLTMSVLAICLTKSSTAICVIFVAAVALVYALISNANHIKSPNIGILFGIYIVFLLLVLAGNVSFLQTFVQDTLHKDLTFTGRTDIWAMVLLYISQKPLWGWGIIESETGASMMKNLSFVNAHNQWLQVLWQGGIFLFVIYAFLYVLLLRRLSNQFHDKLTFTAAFVFLAFLIEMIFEVVLNVNISWLLLMVLYYTPEIGKCMFGCKKWL